ncbi:MAG: hypothetical protein ABIN24_04825, partial [Dyadobacter sp.]
MKKNYYTLLVLLLLLVSCKKGDGPNPVLLEAGEPNSGELSNVILKDYFIISIAFDKSGTAWLGTLNQGLIKYDRKTATVFNSSNSLL